MGKNKKKDTRPISQTAQKAASLGATVPEDRRLDTKTMSEKLVAQTTGMEYLQPIEQIRKNKAKAAYIMDVVTQIDGYAERVEVLRANEEREAEGKEPLPLPELDISHRNLGDILSVVEDHFLLDVQGYDRFVNNPADPWAVQYANCLRLANAVVSAFGY